MIRKILNLLNLLFSLSAIVTLIWFHGYHYQPQFLFPHLTYLYICYGFYLVQYITRAWLSGNIKGYFRANKLETFLFSFLSLEMILRWFTDVSIVEALLSYVGVENHDEVFILFLHLWLLVIVGIELGKATARSTIWKLSPPVLFILSFVVLIVSGSSLLMLPEMTADKEGMSFTNALFTSISANCVTGLTVVDTATFFTFKGKMLLLLLIQFGGLNVIAFATFFISFFRKKIEGYRNQAIVKELLHTDSLDDTRAMVRRVVFTTLFIELIGTIILYQQWDQQVSFVNNRAKLFYSVFHAVSAFNNAGFTLFTDGFTNAAVKSTYALHITMALLIVLGGLGFTTLQDIYNKVRHGFKIKFPLQTKLALLNAGLLILTGSLVFYLAEREHLLSRLTGGGSLVTSLFQSVTARTAGFNTVDFSQVSGVVLVSTILLMFIGTASGSTGGGIKTSTFSVLLLALLKRKQRVSDYGTSFLTRVLVKKATSILLYSLGVIAFSMAILLAVEPDKTFVQLIFEEVSAFGTVGLSTGVTSHLSIIGKSVIMASMFIGRIGPLALAYTLIHAIKPSEQKEETGIMIG